MSIETRTAQTKDYPVLCGLFNAANAQYKRLRTDFYRSMPQTLPPRWKFNILLRGQKLGLFNSVAMIVACKDDDVPLGAIYMESVKRTPRSWSAFEKTAWIETLVIDPHYRGRGIEGDLIRAGKSWAVKTGHFYLNVKDIASHPENHDFYAAEGLSPDYIIQGCHL